jgi:hypothetical protein
MGKWLDELDFDGERANVLEQYASVSGTGEPRLDTKESSTGMAASMAIKSQCRNGREFVRQNERTFQFRARVSFLAITKTPTKIRRNVRGAARIAWAFRRGLMPVADTRNLVLHELGFGSEIDPRSCELQKAVSHNREPRLSCGVHRFAGQRSIMIRLRAVRAVIADVHLGCPFPAMRHRVSTINVPLIY